MSTLPAKLTRPDVPGVLRRDRLFGLLDGPSTRWAWITGPPGSGKTSLVSSWLEGHDLPAFWYRLDGEDNHVPTLLRYLRHLAPRAPEPDRAGSMFECPARLTLFARRFFEAWWMSIERPFVVVFDDCHEIRGDSPCSAVFAGALAALSPGALLVGISREGPPCALARFSAGQGFVCAGADELRFSDEEAQALARSWSIDDQAGVRRANALTRGWALGLSSLLRGCLGGCHPGLPLDPSRSNLFDYFATEVLGKLPARLQRFLLSTCVLPRLSGVSARELSGSDDASEMLAFLYRHGLFLDWPPEIGSADDPRYEYHPLFRDFLLAHARRTWTAAEWGRQNQRAGALLEAGDESTLDSSIADMSRLLAANDGAIPEETAVSALRSGHGLLLVRPHDRMLPSLAERAVTLARRLRDADERIAVGTFALHYFVWTGDLARAKALSAELDVGSLEASHASRISLALWRNHVIEEEAGPEAALAALRCALEMPRDSAAHEIWQASLHAELAETALRAGRPDVAAEALDAGWPRRGDDWRTQRFRFLRAAAFLLRDDAAEAVRMGREAWRWEPAGSRWPYWDAVFHGWFGVMLMHKGEHAEARDHLAKTLGFARRMPSPILAFDALLALAFTHFDAGERKVGLEHLREAFRLGAEHGYRVHRLFFVPRALTQLCAWALESDIEPVYVRSLIQLQRLPAPELDVEGWPWPVRIYTLGRFAVVLHDRGLSFPRKAPQKPLQLLKALIARGGRAVDHRDLSEQLWPDLEGDASRNALDIALHRLRKLLKSDHAVTTEDGKLTFDARSVWVDAWAFERLSGAIDRWKAETLCIDDVKREADRLLRSYTGHFLAGDDATWAITTRERLRSKFLRAVSKIGQHLEIRGHVDDVSTLYHRAIELDPLTEEFHLGLIKCFGKQRRIAEALCAYRRCRALLSANLGVEPSAPTRAAYLSLRTLATR